MSRNTNISMSALAVSAMLATLLVVAPRAADHPELVVGAGLVGVAIGVVGSRRGALLLVTGSPDEVVQRRFAGLLVCLAALVVALAGYLPAPALVLAGATGGAVAGLTGRLLLRDAVGSSPRSTVVRGLVMGIMATSVAPSITAATTVFVTTRAWDFHTPATDPGRRFGLVLAAAVALAGGAAVSGDRGASGRPSFAPADPPPPPASNTAVGSGARPLLEVEGIELRYGKVQVLFGTSFHVTDGEALALLGTNGAGKSSVLRAVFGLTPPSAGRVIFDGRDITGRPAEELVRLGLVEVPGGRGVFPSLTVRENLRMAGYLHRDERRADEGIERTLATFPRLAERIDRPAGLLSGGEQQMMALARAWITRPRLLAIDELTLGLAPVVVEELKDVVRTLQGEGVSMILVEQSVHVALDLTQRACFLERGCVRFDGPTVELAGRDDLLRSIFFAGAVEDTSA